jgi:hypothetical protein
LSYRHGRSILKLSLQQKEAGDNSVNTFLEGLSVIAEHEPPIDDSSTSNDEEEKDDALNQIERATDNNNPTTPTPIAPTTPSPSRRPATTSRNSSSTTKKRLAQCRKGARIKVTRNNLMHCLLLDAQKEALAGFGNHRNFYGTVLSGSGRQGYMILFDDLPAGNQQVTIRRRNIMTVVQGNEEEHEYDHRSAVPNACAEINRGRKEDPMKASAKLFCGMEKDIIATATTYHMQYGNAEGEVIDWKIVPDDEHLDWAMPDIPTNVEFLREIPLDVDSDLCDVFFEEFFPSVKGHAKLIDEFHSNSKSPYFLYSLS